ncbi:MAG: PAS domain S-box protein [Anaerolineaceae bacterium]|nr:PAS domain S-box protein [Anaerolineaceae bacterium]
MREAIRKGFTYKIIISILFGLLGFALNFHTINFSFPPYVATVLIGLIFPMLVTFAWGWKYGLLSALVGGCQSMWWVWGPSNGYATFVVVPPFTLWIVWHGWMADFRTKQTDSKWWLSAYAVEIPFRILNTINLFTLSRWAISLNPPPWTWASNAPDTIPMDFSIFVVIKQAVVGYIILLLADVLLNLGFVRKFFGLEKEYNQVNTNFIIRAAFLVGAFFWIVDSTISTLVFQPESSFLDSLALNVSAHDIFIRTVFLLVSLAGGVLASNLLRGQRESDDALRDSEERLKQIIEGNPTPIFVIGEKHTITHWNKVCENLTGFPANEMVGTQKQWLPFYSEERPILADLIMDEATEKDISKNYGSKYNKSTLIKGAYEVEDFFPGLDDKWLFFTAAPLRDHHGKVIGAIETLRDITEIKQAEKELKQYSKGLEQMVFIRTRELEDTNQELTDFAYVVSHDLKAPLRGISQLAHWISSDYTEVLDQDGQEKLRLLISRTKRMHLLIEGILQYSRVGRAAAEVQSVDLNQLVNETIEILAPPENIQISIENELPAVEGMYTYFEQVFLNLLSNAIKFIDKPQGFVKIGCVGKEDSWLFSVADNGSGIDEKYFDKIFQMFQTLAPSNYKTESTGIGLPLVKKIVGLWGGRVWLESVVGEGSTFFFTVPKEGEKNERQ